MTNLYQSDYNQERAWFEISQKIIASFLTDYGTITENTVTEDFIHPAFKELFVYITDSFHTNHTIVTMDGIENELSLTARQLAERVRKQFDPDFNATIQFSMDHLRGFSARAQLSQLAAELAKASGDSDQIIADVENKLRDIKNKASIFRDGRIASVLISAREKASMLGLNIVKTNIDWLDRSLNGGCYRGHNYWVSGAYKSGKTTFIRNVVLNVLEQGHPAAIIMAESSREMLSFDFLAMITNKILLESDATYTPRLSGIKLMNILGIGGSEFGVFTSAEYEALEEAQRRLETFSLYLYDTTDGITNLQKLSALVSHLTSQDVRFFVADHSQLFGDPSKTMFERQSETARFVQDISIREDITFWMLTQQNEEKLKGKFSKSSRSIGVRGGGDAAAAAELMLETSIDEVSSIMSVNIAHSRRSLGGTYECYLDLNSGLIIDNPIQNEIFPEDFSQEEQLSSLEETFLNDFSVFDHQTEVT